MVDLKDYNLVFWSKEDESRWIGKRVIPGQYVVYNPVTCEKLRLHRRLLNAMFVSDKANDLQKLRRFKRIA